MMSLFEAAWVIARRDFVATVYSRSFILFLVAPLVVIGMAIAVTQIVNEAESYTSRPVVAVVADTATTRALDEAADRLIAATDERVFPVLRVVAPAENVQVQAGQLLADEQVGYSAVFSGTLERPVLTGPTKVDESVGDRIQLIVDDARRAVALQSRGATSPPVTVTRVVTAQAAGNLQLIRRDIARSVQTLIFTVTVMLATLLLSNLAEEKSNKVIEILAAAVPLDAVFLGKLIAMLGISFVGLAVWGGMLGGAYLLLQAVQDWLTWPQVGPAVGWPVYVILVLIYYASNYMILGGLFIGIGGQANSIREIQTLSMPVTMLQVGVFLLAITVVGREDGALTWFAYLLPFSSPLAMLAFAAKSDQLWPHLVALLWQALWIVLILRIAARLFRRTVLKSAAGGGFFDFAALRRGAAE